MNASMSAGRFTRASFKSKTSLATLAVVYSRNEIADRRMRVRIRLLEIDKVRTPRLQKAVNIEHPDLGLRCL